MALQDILLRNSPRMTDLWYEKILESYPPETANFLREQTDSFANPIGQTMVPALEALYAGLVSNAKPQDILPHVDAIMRIRAVQDFTAAQAVFCVYQLKGLVREQFKNDLASCADELRAFEDRIDLAMLMAFDVYSECREQIHDIKTKEFRTRMTRMPERTNRVESDS